MKSIFAVLMVGGILTGCSSNPARTVASEMTFAQTTTAESTTNKQEELKLKLFDRFEKSRLDPSLPPFLESMRDENQRFADYLDPLAAQAILDSDRSEYSGKISDLVSRDQVLIRQIKKKYLFDFLLTRKILPRSENYGAHESGRDQSYPAVYLELRQRNNMRGFDWGDVDLHFSPKILDRDDYIITPKWNFGNYHPYSAVPAYSKDRGRVKFYIESYLSQVKGNEFVFLKPVDVSFLEAIYVPKGNKVKLIAELKKKNAPLPKHWKNWNERIFER